MSHSYSVWATFEDKQNSPYFVERTAFLKLQKKNFTLQWNSTDLLSNLRYELKKKIYENLSKCISYILSFSFFSCTMIDWELSVPYVTSRQNIPTLLLKEICDTRITLKNVLVEKRKIKLFHKIYSYFYWLILYAFAR